MNTLKKLCYLLAALFFSAAFVSCSDDDEMIIEQMTPSQTLASTPWETTGAKDKNGQSVDLNDASVNGYVGFAYFKGDGSFVIYGLNDAIRSRGTWSVDAMGTRRTITALNPDGTTIFTRDVEILVLNRNEFTYRIRPNAADQSIYYDIIHTRTLHAEPSNGQLTLASTPWETTGAKNSNGQPVDLADSSVAGYVGYSYFKANGTFAIYGLNNAPRSKGTWSISPDGKKRTLTALDDAGNVIFTRVVDILTLNSNEFTYRITDAANPSVYYDIIHKSVSHNEPH
ncbi:MAG: DUF4822 domain-containing protein [Chryseobacterium sp.]|jgi:hypothetical protein|uniref:DUF4822 domain-containing protein n=1 Tax=Chryseobacterium sp. TaxID=1871047 RepID=UPI0028248C97|nr:DUF4822 domain-containing protein [Chryseobacterium sp.]MDR2238685.1 DUF4822 domain-containing protein [Chryseobacterium sp.]